MTNILLTGATGFVGQALAESLFSNYGSLTCAVRKQTRKLSTNYDQKVIGSICPETDWSDALTDIDIVIHCAAKAHVLGEMVTSMDEFRKVNTFGALNLAESAAKAGVRRFVFISSIGVNGNNNMVPFSEESKERPKEKYAVSKYEAEQGLLALIQKSSMEVVIIRPPLVYGPNAPGNFGSLVRWMNKSIPLPLGAIHNQRSLVALENLVSFIVHCIKHPKAANKVFLISDGEDVSTSELLRKVASAFGKRSWLIPVPVFLIAFVAKLIGKGDVTNRLFSSLQVNSSKARTLLDWKPVIAMDEQLKKIADVEK